MSLTLLQAASEETVVNKRLAAKQAKYQSYVKALKEVATSGDPAKKASWERANAAMRERFLTPGAVHVDSALSNISIQYQNEEYIGLELMPVATVPKLSDKYFIYDKRSRLAYPDDAMGARSSANEISDTRSQDNYSCQSYGLKNYVDALTLANQDAPLDEMIDLIEAVAEGISFRREVRIATKMCTSSNYGSNTTAIAAANRWDSAGGGNPIADIQNAIKNLWMGRGPSKKIGFCSLDVWLVLSRHPKILDLFKYGGTAPGLATPAMIAKFFDLDDILVAKARNDSANEAQAASYGRIWSDVFGVVRVAQRPSIRTASFGYTMRFGQVRTDEWYDPSLGTQGGYYGRVSTQEDHKIVAADTGYLITTPIG